MAVDQPICSHSCIQEDRFSYWRGPQETRDIAALLPQDPFEMEQWQSLGLGGVCNLVYLNDGLRLRAFPGYTGFKLYMNVPSVFDSGYTYNMDDSSFSLNDMMDIDSHPRGFVGGVPNFDDILFFENANMDIARFRQSEVVMESGPPHPAMEFALRCLGVRDLLSIERVCSSLHSAVKNDPWLWRNIRIDSSLHEKVTDDALLQLTNRAQGDLQCLSLKGCSRITNDGLYRVLVNNPKLIKLNVPGCTKLSIIGILASLKSLNTGLKYIRLGCMSGVTLEHIEELKSVLGVDSNKPQLYVPHFFRGSTCMSLENDRAIDLEMCPRCENIRLVFDCPRESCQAKDYDDTLMCCRACRICIPRCFDCGRCVNGNEYEEMFCLETICCDCVGLHKKRQQVKDPGVLEPNNMEIIHLD